MSYLTREIDDKIVELLQGGGVGILPTDTIYGLSASALNKEAVEKVHRLKGREGGKPLIVLIGDILQLPDIGLKAAEAAILKRHWPGPLSVEFNAMHAPEWLHRGKYFFAVRMPANENLRNLITKVGPIVSSSANLHGQDPAKSVDDAKRYFKGKLDFYVDAGMLEGLHSTLVKIDNGKINVIRHGAYKLP